MSKSVYRSIASWFVFFKSLVSSENKKNSGFLIILCKSFIEILKRKVDKWFPWGKPDGTLNLDEQKLRYLTILKWLDEKEQIQESKGSENPK